MSKIKVQKMEVNGKTYYPRIQAGFEDPKDIQSAALPVGRVSVDNEGQTIGSLLKDFLNEYSSVDAKFPLEYLGVIQNLSIANADVSQMVDNIVQLGNTGHKVVVTTKKEGQEQAVLEELNSFSKRVFHRFGGVDGFVNSCLGQVARTGAGSVEWVVEDNLNGLDKVVFVPVCSIRFLLDDEEGEYAPYQKLNDISKGMNNLIPLNTATYQYVAHQLLDNSPYAIPPIMAALESITIQRDIVKNFKFVAKKMGLLGFVSCLLKAPQKIANEKDDVYIARMRKVLDDAADQLKSNFRDGIALGFKDNMEIKVESLMQSAPGATEIFKHMEEQVFSGLKSDPALHGRTYSTTETYAGVVYEKMLQIITNYQRPVKQILEYGFKLHLNLMGIEYEELYVEFQASKSLSAERDEATYQLKLANLTTLYNQGIIDQNQYAQEAGYDDAALEAPLSASEAPDSPPPDAKEKQSRLVFNKQSQVYTLSSPPTLPEEEEESLEEAYARCLEQVLEDCGHEACAADPFDAPSDPVLSRFRAFVSKYFRAVFPNIRFSRRKAVNDAVDLLKKFPTEAADSSLFAETVYKKLSSSFGEALANTPIASNVAKNVNNFYKYYRAQDASPFDPKASKAPIKPSFNLVDENALKFLKKSDKFYFGKFIENPETRAKLKKWLENDYLVSGRNLKDKGELAAFRKRFGNEVGKEDYKVLRVVNTSVSRAKNWGNILNVQQAGGVRVEIAGPVDNRTCPWCESMAGNVVKDIKPRRFTVAPLVEHVNYVSAQDPEDLPKLSPFLPGKIHPKVLQETSEEQLLAQGIALPPYHPNCRHRFIVVEYDDD